MPIKLSPIITKNTLPHFVHRDLSLLHFVKVPSPSIDNTFTMSRLCLRVFTRLTRGHPNFVGSIHTWSWNPNKDKQKNLLYTTCFLTLDSDDHTHLFTLIALEYSYDKLFKREAWLISFFTRLGPCPPLPSSSRHS